MCQILSLFSEQDSFPTGVMRMGMSLAVESRGKQAERLAAKCWKQVNG
jgi:hypothetical protein